MSYYTVLGVPETADASTIHNAFRALARQYHPDAGEGSSPVRFREIVEAYETLSDPGRRRAYHRTLRPASPIPVRVTRDDVFVEPLAQQWFASGVRVTPLRHAMGIGAIEQLFEEMFRMIDRDFFEGWF